jgi:pimeloyl-ACP methyl ester carboxylesterase
LTDHLANGDRVETTANLAAIEVRQVTIDGQLLQVAVRHGGGSGLPLLLFNGIGANWELAKPFLEALTSTTAIIFDVPGVGGSPRPMLPYRPSTLARLAAGLVAELGYAEIDVAGVSWGGGIAQQFAHQYPKLCRRLVLAATAPGFTMVPASPSVLWKVPDDRRRTPVHRDAAGGNRWHHRGISGRREQAGRAIIAAHPDRQFGQGSGPYVPRTPRCAGAARRRASPIIARSN